MAVVTAVKLDDLLLLSESPRQSQHAHAGLGATVGEADHLDLDFAMRFLLPFSATRGRKINGRAQRQADETAYHSGSLDA